MFGNFQKIGSRKFIDVLTPAEEPKKGAGLYFMDTSSAAGECLTLQAAAGFNIHLFPTGQGNIIGNAIEPVVDPDTTWELETKLKDINGKTIGKVTLTSGSYG